jgi:plastocyanin
MKTIQWFACWVVAAAAACGGGSSSMSSDPTTSGTSVAATVAITEYQFTPETTRAAAGKTVQWVNNGLLTHTTVSDNNVWTSGQLTGGMPTTYAGTSGGQSYNYTFNTAGTYSYHCVLHPPATYPGFVGTVIVSPWPVSLAVDSRTGTP